MATTDPKVNLHDLHIAAPNPGCPVCQQIIADTIAPADPQEGRDA